MDTTTFSKPPIYIPTRSVWGLQSSSTTWVWSVFFILAEPIVGSPICFHCISLMTDEVEHFLIFIWIVLLWRPVDQSCWLFCWLVSYLLIGAPDMSSLSVICAVMSSPDSCGLYFSPPPWRLWRPWGWAAVKLRLLPGLSSYSVSHLPAFAGTNFIIRQRIPPLPLLQGKTSPGSQLRKAEKTFLSTCFSSFSTSRWTNFERNLFLSHKNSLSTFKQLQPTHSTG